MSNAEAEEPEEETRPHERNDAFSRAPRSRGLAWPTPLRSLTSRFIATLVAGVLFTSLAVSWISIQSTESFLREKINHKFVTTLSATRQRLELWYSERELEIETLARSATLVRATDPSSQAGSSGVERYLSLVLEQLPQLDALFLLNAEGEPYVWIGPERNLPASLRVELGAIGAASVSDLLENEAGRLHIASAPILGDKGERLGSVHALINDAPFDELLQSESISTFGRILIVGTQHEVLAPRGSRSERPRFERSLPGLGDATTIEHYEVEGGTSVIGGTLAFSRFGWTLVVEEPYADAFAPVVAISRRTSLINLAIVALFSSIAFLVARSIVRPMRALSVAADEIAAGDRDVVIPVSTSSDEIGLLTRAFHEMTARLRQKQEELEEKNDALEVLAITDGLTGLYNHRYFQLQLDHEMLRADRSKAALSLIVIDIDDFKGLNDKHGHVVGDRTLKVVASAMLETIRKSDLLARYGGEEFVVLSFSTSLEHAGVLAEKLRLAVSQAKIAAPAGSGVEWVEVTVSAGVAEYQGKRDLFEQADKALYRAKASGKDCVVTAS